MRVLHITNEFTKKNFSISSLILYLSDYLYKNYNHTYSILTSGLEKDLFAQKGINLIKIKNWAYFFTNQKELISNIKNSDCIHIHGIWAPIQIISLLICIRMKLFCIVHPHGMFLEEAIKSAGSIKFIIKKITLFLLKLLISNNITFVSITSQETKAIKKYFPNNKVNEISNPIPFTFHEIEKSKSKKIVYFGRIHPHKNLELVIESFKKSNLPKEWKLELYGIRDDEKYYLKLKKLVDLEEQIEIKEPIFGKDKQLVMKSAWLNVLISKSEVLSLSILESSLFGLPSLVNKDIEIKGLENNIIFTGLNSTQIANHINQIAKWSEEERYIKEENIINNVKQVISIEQISKKYNLMYSDLTEYAPPSSEDIIETQKSSIFNIASFKKNIDFLTISAVYTFNLMFVAMLVISLVILGYFSIAGELGLITSLWITTTQIFSSNMRSIIVSEQKNSYAQGTLLYRIILSVLLLLIFYIFSNRFYFFENYNLIFITSCLIMLQWINEMNLVKYEIAKRISYFKFFLSINVLIIVFSILFLAIKRLDLLQYILIIYSLFIFINEEQSCTYYLLYSNYN